jgi:hypothetical protein
MAASPSLFLATFLVDQAPTRKARCARSETSTNLLNGLVIVGRVPQRCAPAGYGEYPTRQGRRPSAPHAHRRGVVVRGSVCDPATTATRHCSSWLSSSAQAASTHSSLPQLLALLTRSALRPVAHDSGQSAQINRQRLPRCHRRRRLDEATRLGRTPPNAIPRAAGHPCGSSPPGSTSTCRAASSPRQPRGHIDRTDTDVRAPRSRTSVPGWTRSSWPPRPPRVHRAAGLRLPSHALGSASALAGRLVAAAVNLSGELRMCHDGHHRDNEQPVLSSEGCEAGTSHTGVSFPTSSLCF